MSNDELNLEFDILYNNVSSNGAPGLSLYEKSVFLTLAQDLILKAYLHPIKNKLQEGYDDSAERNIDFSNITVTKIISHFENVDSLLPATDWHKEVVLNTDPDAGSSDDEEVSDDSNDYFDILQIINEVVVVQRGISNTECYLQCTPLPYDNYTLIQSQPYKFPTRYQAWRIINNGSVLEKRFELIAGFNDKIVKYIIKYIRRPNPIILQDLQGLTIRGFSLKSECEVDPILHHDILLRAVELAKTAYYNGGILDMLVLNNASSTELGQLTGGSKNE